MSLYNKKSIFENEDIAKFSPLKQFFYYDLTVDQINEELLTFDSKFQKYRQDKTLQSRYDEIVGYAIKAVDEAFAEIKEAFQGTNNLLGEASNFDRLSFTDVRLLNGPLC